MRTQLRKSESKQQSGSLKSTVPSLANKDGLTSNHSANELLTHDFSRIPLYSKIPLNIQAKLTVSSPGDKFEQEADRAADTVMDRDPFSVSQVSQGVQPKLYRMELRPEDRVDSMSPSDVEAKAESPENKPNENAQRSANGDAGVVTPSFERSLQRATESGGRALPDPTRSFMESRFGWDFSSVRVHSDARADSLSREINARAFTLDKDIFFAGSQYQPDSPDGQHLLAHELTHVVQQSNGRISRQIQRLTSCSSYSSFNASAGLDTYNCAGLALRTYQDISPPSDVINSIVANFSAPVTPSGNACGAGKVKFWLWEYDMHLEDDTGAVLSSNRRDFHIVAGRADATGADPTIVYSKNGYRLVHGPGTGPSFRPATRERALSNDATETPAILNGRPAFKVRSNMSEAITCAGCGP